MIASLTRVIDRGHALWCARWRHHDLRRPPGCQRRPPGCQRRSGLGTRVLVHETHDARGLGHGRNRVRIRGLLVAHEPRLAGSWGPGRNGTRAATNTRWGWLGARGTHQPPRIMDGVRVSSAAYGPTSFGARMGWRCSVLLVGLELANQLGASPGAPTSPPCSWSNSATSSRDLRRGPKLVGVDRHDRHRARASATTSAIGELEVLALDRQEPTVLSQARRANGSPERSDV